MNKKPKQYTQPEVPEMPIASEPIAEYQHLPNIQLEADKAQLIREIINIESRSVFDKVKQQIREVLNIKEEIVDMKPDSKEYIVTGLKDAFRELKKIKEGKSQTYSIEEVLKDMRKEAESND